MCFWLETRLLFKIHGEMPRDVAKTFWIIIHKFHIMKFLRWSASQPMAGGQGSMHWQRFRGPLKLGGGGCLAALWTTSGIGLLSAGLLSTKGLFCYLRHMDKVLRLFSHNGKLRILNFNSKCAFWITQCTHDWSTCVFWITQYTHERPKFGFWIPAGEECLGTLPIKHAWSSHFLCFYTYAARAVYRRKWLEGHTSSAPQNTI